MAKAVRTKSAKKTSTVKAVAKKDGAAKAVTKAASKKAVAGKDVAKKAAPKKAAAKTTVKAAAKEEKKSVKIKYEDKSAGQPELVVIFEAIKKMLVPYHQKRALVLHADKPSQALLVSHKPLVIDGRPRNELWFVAALVQKGYVGFYYMPINMNKEMRKQFSDEFIKTLKGKACFHIKKNTPQIMADIKKAIKVGYDAYVERGWL